MNPWLATYPLAITTAMIGCAGTDTEPDSRSRECVDSAPNEYRFVASGREFHDHNGQTVYAVTAIALLGSSDINCYGVDRGAITNGTFEVEAINRTNTAVYPLIGVFVDRDDDGRCQAHQDLIWGTTATIDGDGLATTGSGMALTPDQLSTQDDNICDLFAAAAR
ncbi:MAG: hypothetical protein AB7O24_14330 [Kofleriaceae bacterium]